MKKLYKYLALVFVCVACMPLFAACNGEGSSLVRGVRFTQDVYYLDLYSPTKLDYKLYPSTSEVSGAVYTLDTTGNAGNIFTFDDKTGIFEIMSSNFADMKVKIVVGDYSDECIVSLKKYPSSINFEVESDYINMGSLYTLKLFGRVGGEQKLITGADYNLEIVSDNPKVISVDSNNNLVVCANDGEIGSATITAKIKNGNGNYITSTAEPNGIEAKITLTVIETVQKAYVVLEGEQNFIELSTDYANIKNYTTKASSIFVQVLFKSTSGNVVNTDAELFSSNTSVATITKTDGGYTINLISAGSANIEISTSANSSSGQQVKYIFKITKQG